MSSSPPPAPPPEKTAPAEDAAPPGETGPPGEPNWFQPPAAQDLPAEDSAAPADPAAPSLPSLRRALISAAVVSAIVTLVSWLAPKSYAATGVGLAFLAATWFLTIRPHESDARVWGLSLGGLLDRERISGTRLLRE